MPLAPAGEPEWIDKAEQLPAVAEALAAAPWIALDSEGNSMHAYHEKICLLQLNAGGRIFLIDTMAVAAAAGKALKSKLEGREIWLHGGEYDVGCLKRDLGIALSPVFDTQQAASMLGYDQTGYGSVVDRLLGVRLDKAFATHDWGIRPIEPAALTYATDDVRHLPAVAEKLKAAVKRADLEEEVSIACAAVAESTWNGGFSPDGFWKIKGVRELPVQARGMLCALWSWRDGIASERNQPPGRLINNEQLLALARHSPTSFQHLKAAGMRGWQLAELGDSLIAMMQAARASLPPIPPPPRTRDVSPQEEERERKLKDWRRAECERRNVTLQAVLPAKSLEWLKQHGAGDLSEVPQLGAKRAKLYGEKLKVLCR